MVQPLDVEDKPLQDISEDSDKPSPGERLKHLYKSAKDVAKRTVNLGRPKDRSQGRHPTNPLALAARRVFRESLLDARKWTFHIVSGGPSILLGYRVLHPQICFSMYV